MIRFLLKFKYPLTNFLIIVNNRKKSENQIKLDIKR